MGNRRNGYGGAYASPQYTESQVEAILDACGIGVSSETGNDFLVFCPYHGNRSTPSMTVSKEKGIFICHNGACTVAGTLIELIKDTTKKNDFEAVRLITKMKTADNVSFTDRLEKALTPEAEMPEFPQDVLDRLYEDMWGTNDIGRTYMRGRGFADETLREFRVGYSAKQNMVITPMHDIRGNPVGLIGRSASSESKAFKNSVKLPTSKSLFNIHRARRAGEVAIICEANFDAMRISQAGYPNVVACLGGNFSPHHLDQLERNFSGVLIFTDFDDKSNHRYVNCKKCGTKGYDDCQGHNPGRALGEKIASSVSRMPVKWASIESGIVYPPGVKDAGDMEDDQIRSCIKNAVSNYEYHRWGIAA